MVMQVVSTEYSKGHKWIIFGNDYEYLYNLYCSPNIIRVIKSGRMTFEGHRGMKNISHKNLV
jgi:hypothetical protein